MIDRWKNLAWILCLLTMSGCSGKVVEWIEEPTDFDEKVQEIRKERIKSEPIVPSNAEQRLEWREDRSKQFHKMRQLYNPEYEDFTTRCLTGDTLELYLRQEKQIRHEKINRPNKRRSR